MLNIDGTFVALVTPFTAEGGVDEDALRALVNHVVEGGVEGLVPCGTTGESVTLSDEEHLRVVRIVVEEAGGRVPVVAGTGTVSTAHTIALTRGAKEAGANGALIVCPYYNRPTQAGLEAHFRAVLKEVSIPTVLYNIPKRTGIDLEVATLERLSDVKDIVGIKEATGTVARSQAIVSACGERFSVVSGDDGLTLPIMAVGGRGVISVSANVFPKETSEVARTMLRGDLQAAREQHLALLNVHQSMFIEANPAPAKWALSKMGLMRSDVRLPLVAASEQCGDRLLSAFTAAGLELKTRGA